MQYCEKCDIQIRGNKARCPLCAGSLTGEAELPAFPVLQERRVSRVSAFKVAAFVCVLIVLSMGIVSYFTQFRYHFPQIVSIASALALLDFAVVLYFRSNPLRMLQTQVYLGMIVIWLIDRLTGFHAWSVIWAIPVIFVVMQIVVMAIGQSLRSALTDYVIYPLVNAALSLLQMIPIANGNNHFPYPAVISMGVLVAFSAFLVIFRFRELKSAITRYFNV